MRIPGTGLGCALCVLGLAGGPAGQERVLYDPAGLGSGPRESWKAKPVPSIGAEFFVPAQFQELVAKHFYTHRLFQGRLGGAHVKVHLNEIPGKFQTVSRVLLALSARSTIVDAYAFHLEYELDKDGRTVTYREPAALVRRRTKDPVRTVLETVVCPRRRGITLQLEFLTDPGPQALAAGHRLVGCLNIIEQKNVTIVKRGPAAERQSLIDLGFDATVRDRVAERTSAHYRLFTLAPSGQKLLEFLEKELLTERILPLLGPAPQLKLGKLPIFLHGTKQEYQLAALNQGIPREQVEAMQGYAWDRYYTTWYDSPRSAIHIHEGTHQYVTQVLGLDGGGPWLQEGLARLIEAEYQHRRIDRVGHNLRKRLKSSFPKLRDLVRMTTFLQPTRTDGLKSTERYDIAAALLYYVSKEHHNDFRELILQAGVLPPGNAQLIEDAFRRSVRRDLEALEREWHAWLLDKR